MEDIQNKENSCITYVSKKMFSCSLCSLTKHRKELPQHLCNHMGTMPFKCSTCHVCFISETFYASHILKHLGKNVPVVYRCHICEIVLPNFTNLAEHFLCHLLELNLKCNLCNVFFSDRKDVTIHRHLHEESLSCSICGKIFPDKLELLEHVISHSEQYFRLFPKHRSKKKESSKKTPRADKEGSIEIPIAKKQRRIIESPALNERKSSNESSIVKVSSINNSCSPHLQNSKGHRYKSNLRSSRSSRESSSSKFNGALSDNLQLCPLDNEDLAEQNRSYDILSLPHESLITDSIGNINEQNVLEQNLTCTPNEMSNSITCDIPTVLYLHSSKTEKCHSVQRSIEYTDLISTSTDNNFLNMMEVEVKIPKLNILSLTEKENNSQKLSDSSNFESDIIDMTPVALKKSKLKSKNCSLKVLPYSPKGFQKPSVVDSTQERIELKNCVVILEKLPVSVEDFNSFQKCLKSSKLRINRKQSPSSKLQIGREHILSPEFKIKKTVSLKPCFSTDQSDSLKYSSSMDQDDFSKSCSNTDQTVTLKPNSSSLLSNLVQTALSKHDSLAPPSNSDQTPLSTPCFNTDQNVSPNPDSSIPCSNIDQTVSPKPVKSIDRNYSSKSCSDTVQANLTKPCSSTDKIVSPKSNFSECRTVLSKLLFGKSKSAKKQSVSLGKSKSDKKQTVSLGKSKSAKKQTVSLGKSKSSKKQTVPLKPCNNKHQSASSKKPEKYIKHMERKLCGDFHANYLLRFINEFKRKKITPLDNKKWSFTLCQLSMLLYEKYKAKIFHKYLKDSHQSKNVQIQKTEIVVSSNIKELGKTVQGDVIISPIKNRVNNLKKSLQHMLSIKKVLRIRDLAVLLLKLPEEVYNKHEKGEPILLTSVLPLIGNFQLENIVFIKQEHEDKMFIK